MDIFSELKKRETFLTGAKTTEQDVKCLANTLPQELVPSWLPICLQEFKLAGTCFSLDEKLDKSELGADIKWFTVSQMLEEALEVYPGKVVLDLGYLPIAACLFGSGDPYFLKVLNDGEDPTLVRIPHNFASEDKQYPENEIEVICDSLSEFFSKATIY